MTTLSYRQSHHGLPTYEQVGRSFHYHDLIPTHTASDSSASNRNSMSDSSSERSVNTSLSSMHEGGGFVNDSRAYLNLPDSDELLPQYSTGAEVTPKSHAENQNLKNALTILLGSRAQPVYDVGDIIEGSILFAPWENNKYNNVSTDDHQQQVIAIVGVVLESHEITTSSTGVLASHTVTKLRHHIVPDLAMPPDGVVYPGFVYKFPFSIQVPEARSNACRCSSNHHDQLAPSVGVPGGSLVDSQIAEMNGGVPKNATRIYYRLRAFVKDVQPETKKLVTLCKGHHDLRIVPSYAPTFEQSPSENDHEGKIPAVVTVTHEVNHGSSGFWLAPRKTTGVGLMKVQMPGRPVLFALDTPFSTTVPIDLTFEATSTAENERLPQIDKVVLMLECETSYSMIDSSLSDEKDEKPSATTKTADSDIKTVVSQTVLVDVAGKSFKWNRRSNFEPEPAGYPLRRSSLDQYKENLYEINSSISFKWNVSNKNGITPGFESCCVRREYKLITNIHIHGTKSPVRVAVPAEVVASLHPRSIVPSVSSRWLTS